MLGRSCCRPLQHVLSTIEFAIKQLAFRVLDWSELRVGGAVLGAVWMVWQGDLLVGIVIQHQARTANCTPHLHTALHGYTLQVSSSCATSKQINVCSAELTWVGVTDGLTGRQEIIRISIENFGNTRYLTSAHTAVCY